MADKEQSEKRKHSQAVLVRLTGDQLGMVDRAADRAALNRTGWVRMVLLQAARDQLGEGGS